MDRAESLARRNPADFGLTQLIQWSNRRAGLRNLGLTTHQAIESPVLRLKYSAQTFFGTRIHEPKKVCHNGRMFACLTCKLARRLNDIF
jgi:hypothetical protein